MSARHGPLDQCGGQPGTTVAENYAPWVKLPCASRDAPKKQGPKILDWYDVPWWELDFFGRWLECCVWWKFFVQFFFEKQVQENDNAEINAVNQHKKPKEALLFDKLSLKMSVGFVLDALSKSFAQMAFHLHVTNVLLGP